MAGSYAESYVTVAFRMIQEAKYNPGPNAKRDLGDRKTIEEWFSVEGICSEILSDKKYWATYLHGQLTEGVITESINDYMPDWRAHIKGIFAVVKTLKEMAYIGVV